MRIPPYWAKAAHAGTDKAGKTLSFSAWGWSFTDLAAAKADAAQRAKSVFDHWVMGKQRDSYDYLDRPLREEILDSLSHGGEEIAMVTRNRYGALVLNCASVCFADLDYPDIRSNGMIDAMLLAFSTGRRQRRREAAREATLQRVRDWARDHRQRSLRIYRTRAGLRLLFTDGLYSPNSSETKRLLAELGSDELYRRLTEKQECFRARLTPKPWRCGCERPPNRYPWEDATAERGYREWERKYREKTKAYVACELLESIGEPAREESIKTVVELHDRYACGAPGSALA